MSDETQPIQPVEPEPAGMPSPAVAPAAVAPAVATDMPSLPPQPAVETAPAPRPKGRGPAAWINVALGLALAVAIGGVAFAAGRMTAPASVSANGGDGRIFSGNGPGGLQFGGPNSGKDGQAGQGGQEPRVIGDGGGPSIEGTVTAVTADAITIKTASGQEITIALDSGTTYHQQSSATSSDVTAGGTVIVRLGFNRNGAGNGGASGPTAADVTVVPK
jgi:hypothetical protein